MPCLSSQARESLRVASVAGAAEPPSPVISEVIPWRIFDSARLSASSVISDWPSMSMKPGAIMRSRTSMRRPALARERSPMAAMRSPLIPTSPRNQGAPVPSTIRPPASTRSNSGGVCDQAAAAASITPPTADTRTLLIARTSMAKDRTNVGMRVDSAP